MRIIIEGCDGAGKSTLIKELKKQYKIDSIGLSNNDPTDEEFYSRLLEKHNIIFDRHFISEYIYPKVFERKGNLSMYQIKKLYNKAKKLGYIIVILTSDNLNLRLKKDEYNCIKNKIPYIKSEYLKLAKKLGIKLIHTDNGIQEMINDFNKLIKEEKK